MALYWPEEKVALDIIDDPYRRPFEGDDTYTVLRVTYADLCDFDSYCKIMQRLCELLGKEVPQMPEWNDKAQLLHEALFSNSPEECNDPLDTFCTLFDKPDWPEGLDDVEILASCESEGEFMQAMAQKDGKHVRGVSIWQGPVPPGSYETLSDATRMSTPEYFFLRKANQLSFAEAVYLGIELCGKYRTSLTQYNKEEGYDFLKNTRTSKAALRHYLHDIRFTKEGKRAKRVLRHVTDDCITPMSAYVYLLLCLPRNRGGYALGRAIPSAAFRTEEGFMPSSSGSFLAYDLCWPKKMVALQYTGNHLLTEKNYNALTTSGMKVVCVTDKDIADPDKFDRFAHKLAKHLDIAIPEPTKGWIAARDKLRRQVKIPTFDHMLLTMKDIEKHKDC